MTFFTVERVSESITGTGTGNMTLAGAIAGHRTFASCYTSSDCFQYCLTDNTLWEVGIGRISGSTFQREAVISSSNSNALVSFTGAAKKVSVVAASAAENANCLAFGDGSDGDVTYTGAGSSALRPLFFRNVTFTGSGSLGMNGFALYICGVLDISNAGAGALIGSASSLTGGNGGDSGSAATTPTSGAAGTVTNSTKTVARTLGTGQAGGIGGAGASSVVAINNSSTAMTVAARNNFQGGNGGSGGRGGQAYSSPSSTLGSVSLQSGVTVSTRHLNIRTLADFFRHGVTDASVANEVAINGGCGGCGGGGGARVSVDQAGGGGGAGGVGGMPMVIYANVIARGASTAAGAIASNGGTGGNGGNSNQNGLGGGGGGGGAGGMVIFQSSTGILVESGSYIDVRRGVGEDAASGNDYANCGASGDNPGDGGLGGHGLIQLQVPVGATATVVNPGTTETNGSIRPPASWIDSTNTLAPVEFTPLSVALSEWFDLGRVIERSPVGTNPVFAFSGTNLGGFVLTDVDGNVLSPESIDITCGYLGQFDPIAKTYLPGEEPRADYIPTNATVKVEFQGANALVAGSKEVDPASVTAWSGGISIASGHQFIRWRVTFDLAADASQLTTSSRRPVVERLQIHADF